MSEVQWNPALHVCSSLLRDVLCSMSLASVLPLKVPPQPHDCGRKQDTTHYQPARQAEGETKPRRVRVDAFPRGTVLMNELMGRLMDAARRVPTLREKLYQANFHTTLSGQAMVRGLPGRSCGRIALAQHGHRVLCV